MKRLYLHILLLAAAVTGFVSCAEEDVEVKVHDICSFFEPAPDDNSEEAQIRRAFREKYHSYLLFNDTIQRSYVGPDINGDPYYDIETLGIDYTVGQNSYAGNKYTYIIHTEMDEKKEGLEFVETYLLPHITGNLQPFSWFVCKQINFTDTEGKPASHPYAAVGQRCVAVSTGVLSKLKTDAQRAKVVESCLLAMLGPMLKNHESELSRFYSLTTAGNLATIGASTEADATAVARRHGYIGIVRSTWGSFQTPSRETDTNQFASYLLQYDDEYMEQNFADYPLILRRWYVFKEILAEIGWVN